MAKFSAVLSAEYAADRRAAWLSAQGLIELGATPCDFAWLQCKSHGTLVKLLLRAADSRNPSSLWLGADTLAELQASSGDAVDVTTVAASQVPKWDVLHLRPAAGCAASDLPSVAEVQFDLCYRAQRALHPWRSDCRCRWALLPRHSEISTHPPSRREALRGFASAARAMESSHTSQNMKHSLPASLDEGIRTRTSAGAGTAYADAQPLALVAQSTPVPTFRHGEWGLVSPATALQFTDDESVCPGSELAQLTGGPIARDDRVAVSAEVADASTTAPCVREVVQARVPVVEAFHSGQDPDAMLGVLAAVLQGASARSSQTSTARLTRSVLLCGAPGVGKTALVTSTCHQLRLPLFRITSYELARTAGSTPRAGFAELLQRARRCRPSVIFLDDAHDLAPSQTARLDWELLEGALSLVRSARQVPGVVVVGASPSGTSIHASLRGSFDIFLRLSPPTASQRLRLLHTAAIAARLAPPPARLASRIGHGMHGYLPADIAAICEEAALRARERLDAAADVRTTEVAGRVVVALVSEWDAALAAISPSGLIGLVASTSQPPHGGSRWADVGGLHAVKRRLEELIVWPVCAPAVCARLRLYGPRGVLLYGPPGTGKTLLVRALASKAQLNLLAAPIPQLIRPEVGASERALSSLFERARSHCPCLLFIDELQALFGSRSGSLGAVGRQMLSQLVREIDAAHSVAADTSDAFNAIVIMGATNTPQAIDPALLRPGRLEHTISVPPPPCSARRAILLQKLKGMPLPSSLALEPFAADLARRTDDFTGADLASLCQRAATSAMVRLSSENEAEGGTIEVDMADFEEALKAVQPSVTRDMLRTLEIWTASKGTASRGTAASIASEGTDL